MFGKSKKVGDIIEPLLDEERFAERERPITERPQVKISDVASAVPPPATEAISSISSGLSIIGKIVGQGKLAIFGHVEGEVRASTVQIGDGAQVEGDIVAQELTIGGCVKGTIRANRVKLNSTAMVDGDIYHRSLAIERMRNSGEGHDDRKAGHQRQRTGQGPNGWPGLRASAGRVERWQPEDQWCP